MVNTCIMNSFVLTVLKTIFSRIFEILPARIQNWHSSPCQAEEADKVALEKVRQEQNKARQKLEDLDRKQKQLGEFINNVKQYEIAEATDVNKLLLQRLLESST